MNIVLVSIAYPPEIRSISTMAQELTEVLVLHGHTVTVLTSWPRYNLSKHSANEELTVVKLEGGARVIRVKTLPHHKVHYFLRGIAQITLPFFFLRALKKFVHTSIDGVVVYTPHLPLVKVGSYIKKEYHARYVLNVQDIFPQNAIDLGILKNKLLIRYFERMESKAYRDADVITTCTTAAKDFLIQRKGVPGKKIQVIHNWVDLSQYTSAKATGHFRRKYGLIGKFVIIFPGVLGPSQGLPFVIEIARILQDLPDCAFLFVGDGTERPRLKAMAARYHLSNVRFEDFVNPREYPQLLEEMDIGLLCLENNSKTPTIPGKFFGFAAARLPILALLNPESEGHRIVAEAQCGVALVSDNAQAAADCIRRLYRNTPLLDQWGQNGYDYVTKHFSKAAGIALFERLLVD
ncbi:glycosyltransferase family 4 protein [Candidatus Uhrbacteria bacterium]|nr:glycosyltransferase family 4 protein [Candidatus Uhrbacteria bacterium]